MRFGYEGLWFGQATAAFSLLTIIVRLLCMGTLMDPVDIFDRLAVFWPYWLWVVSPYLGHCGLSWVFRRGSDASKLIFAGTLFSGAVTIFLDVIPSSNEFFLFE